ncbi:MAG: 3-phosphoshikimate 1-carboxyvinyltransferase, partial [Candidatus Eisenbacteria bacterium]
MAVLIAAADPHRLEVRPGPPLGGTFRAPGDKSVTHRAILVGLIARGASLIEDPNPGQDCLDTLSCACSLGLEARSSGGRLELEGRGFSLREPDQVLDCGNSGTTLRLLSGILAGQPFQSVL